MCVDQPKERFLQNWQLLQMYQEEYILDQAKTLLNRSGLHESLWYTCLDDGQQFYWRLIINCCLFAFANSFFILSQLLVALLAWCCQTDAVIRDWLLLFFLTVMVVFCFLWLTVPHFLPGGTHLFLNWALPLEDDCSVLPSEVDCCFFAW